MITAIIMGRKDSKGFPGKNLTKLFGKPLAYYPIAAAKECAAVDRIYMSTDDPRLMKLASSEGIAVIKRPAYLCTDEALGEDVYVHGYNEAKRLNKGKKIDIVVLLMCNAPAVTSRTIGEGIKILRAHRQYDSCVTVSRYNMWSPLRARRIDRDGLLKPFVPFEAYGDPKKLSCDRDSQGDVWFADMGASIIRGRCLEHIDRGLLPQKWMGRKIYPLKQWGGLDVDYEWQLPQVKFWLKENGVAE